MESFKRTLMWILLGFLGLLVAISVYSAFIGAQASRELFNSLQMQVFWFVLWLLLVISLIAIPQLTRKTALALIHIGAILILTGSIWSSETGHRIQRRLLENNKYQAGQIIVEKGGKRNLMVLKNYMGMIELPFSLVLEDFTIEYYQAPPTMPDMRMPRDFISDIKVIDANEVVAAKKIEVNKPLHYGGYYFLQADYGSFEGNPYTVLNVVSDSGIDLVFGGYVFLCIGLFWHLWSKAFRAGKITN